MGRLYLATDPMLGRPLAIKLIRDELEDHDARARFMQEARAAGGLKHPNIVTVFDVGEHEGHPFIAMEFVAGETLGALIERAEPIALGMKLHLTEQLCRGLAHAHRAGLVHRDIKPANLMVDDEGTLRILDFGIARVDGAGLTSTGVAIGTLNYMSPEQVGGQGVDHRSDVFAVGAVFQELLSYQKAFPGTIQDGLMYRIVHGEPASLRAACPDLDPAITNVATRALRAAVDERYQDLDEMANQLVDIRQRVDPSGALASVPAAGQETVQVATAGSKRWMSPTVDGSSPSVQAGAPLMGDATIAARPGGVPIEPTVTGRHRDAARAGRRPRWWVWATGAVAAAAAISAIVAAIPESSAPADRADQASLLAPGGVNVADTTPAPEALPSGAVGLPATAAPPASPSETAAGEDNERPPGSAQPAQASPFAAAGTPRSTGGSTPVADRTPADDRLESLRQSATDLFFQGDREAALDAAAAVVQLVPDDTGARRVLERLHEDALSAAQATRQTAAHASGSPRYQEAERASATSTELLSDGQSAAATRQLWAADRLYAQAAAAIDRTAAAEPIAEATAASTPDRNPRDVAAPDTAAAAEDEDENARAGIASALARYQAALEALDAAALEAIYPAVPQGMLEALETYSTYVVDLLDQPPVITGDTATLDTRLSFSMRMKSGGTAEASGPAPFELRRAGADWLIANIDMSAMR
jgi:hypothetical protein